MADLKELLTALKNKAEDVATLQVATLTGKVNFGAAQGDGKIDLDKIFEQLAVPSPDTNIRLLAYSKFALDSDAIQFVASGLEAGEMPLIEAHNAVVRSAQEARRAVLDMLLSVFDIKLGG